jgi:hypothetical protein
MLSGFFKNLVFQSRKNPVVYAADAQLLLVINKLREELGDGLISCCISKKNSKTILASFNFQESMLPLFQNISQFIEHALIAARFPKLKESFKIKMSHHSLLIGWLPAPYQIFILLDESIANIGILEGIIFPEIKEILGKP